MYKLNMLKLQSEALLVLRREKTPTLQNFLMNIDRPLNDCQINSLGV